MGKARGCYVCGSTSHRGKDCPESVCHLCGEEGHGAGACPHKPEESVDLGEFKECPPAAKFRYVELFAGIGGFRVALDQLGGHCVFASEIDRFARANYLLNHSDRPAGDICKISEDDIPEHDMLVGGFPCQSFSFSGDRKGFDDERGVLFLEIVRIVRKKRPKILLLENVRGLLTHEDGKTLQTIVSHLEDVGYRIHYELLDAVTILPQERKRIYIVGIRSDLPNSNKFNFPILPELNRGFRDIAQTDLDESNIQKLSLSLHQLQKVRKQKYTQQFPTARFLSDFSLPTKTLQSSYSSYMVGSQFVHISPDNEELDVWRRLSPREAARLQGFPESFILCSNRPYHLLGNAVVPSMICFVVSRLLRYLDPPMSSADCEQAGHAKGVKLLLEASPADKRRSDLERILLATFPSVKS